MMMMMMSDISDRERVCRVLVVTLCVMLAVWWLQFYQVMVLTSLVLSLVPVAVLSLQSQSDLSAPRGIFSNVAVAGLRVTVALVITLCLNIINLDSFHAWFLFFIFISLPLQCDVGSRLVLEHLALRLVLVELGALLGSGRDLGNLSTFELSDARLHLSAVLDSKVSVGLLSQGIHPAGQGGLRGEHSRHFALELRAGLSNKLCVVYQAVLGGVVLSLQRLRGE